MKFMKVNINFEEIEILSNFIENKDNNNYINNNEKEKEKINENKNKNILDNNNDIENYKQNNFYCNKDKDKEINEIYKKISKLENAYTSQTDEINYLKESLMQKDLRITELEKKFNLFEKDFLRLQIIYSPLTIRYLYEYFISLVHKNFSFNNRNKFDTREENNEKQNEKF